MGTLTDLVQDLLAWAEGDISAAPEWFRAVVLYLWLTAVWSLVAAFLFWLLGVVDRATERGVRALARALPEGAAETSAAAYVHIGALLTTLRLATGLRLGPGGDRRNGSVLTGFSRRRTRLAASLAFATVSMLPLTLGLVRIAFRRTIPNALIWLTVFWYIGWLAAVVRWVGELDWQALQPSQVAAVLGLVVVAWAVIARSDIRGRVEFNKTASLEGRKCLALIRTQLHAVLIAERKVRDGVVGKLFPFPDKEQLVALTGHHGLHWSDNRLTSSETCRHHDEVLGPQPWPVRAPLSRLVQRPLPTPGPGDEATRAAIEAMRQHIKELRDQGYWYKVVEILPPVARSGLFEIEWPDLPQHAEREKALNSVDRMLDTSHAPHVHTAWEIASTTEDLAAATGLAEREVRRRVNRVRDFLWDGYVVAARLDRLDHAIGRIRLERLVDRLKQ